MQIRTQRLTLRPPALADAACVSMLAGDFDVASMTGRIPHPYSEQAATAWLSSAARGEEGVVFMIERGGAMIGCTGYLPFDADHAELGYWIGKPYWGRGYATEAAGALICHAFDTESFAYIKAGHFAGNDASRGVLEKLGFAPDGEELRDCLARDEAVPCHVYYLNRADAVANFR